MGVSRMKIIILLLILILLSGCGIYNLNNFVLPDDIEFLAVVESLNTPYKISEYMVENFTYKLSPFIAKTPYELWKIGEGDCNDFSTWGVFIADYHGYETWQVEIHLKNTLMTHFIAVYNEGSYSFTDNQYYYSGYNTFEEIVIESCKNIGYELSYYKKHEVGK